MKQYLTADLHFEHKNICGEDGFVSTRKHIENPDVMKEILISAHNRRVKCEDETYILGDISLHCNPRSIYEVLIQLNGQIIVIKGNHDSSKLIKYLRNNNYQMDDGRDKFIVHEVGCILKHKGTVYYLTHYPLAVGRRIKIRSFCGHIHATEAMFSSCLNVGIDSPELPDEHPFGEPILFEKACELVEEKYLRFEDRVVLDETLDKKEKDDVVSITLEEHEWEELERICAEAGITIEELVNHFMEEVVRTGKLPFEIVWKGFE